MTVFVTAETNHNFIKAEAFGDIKFLTLDKRDDFNNIRSGMNNRNMLMVLRAALKDFDYERDYIVLTGSPYISSAVLFILGHRRVPRVRFLRWDNRSCEYVPLTLEFNQET